MPLFFFSPVTRTGEARRRAPAALGRHPGGAAADKGRGKSIKGLWGLDSPAHLGWWRPVDVSPRRRAELGGYGGGGGAGSSGRGCAVVVGVVGFGSGAGVPL